MFKNYLVTIFRSVFRNKFNTAINMAGLAISLACCIFVFAFVRHEKSFDAFHADAARTYRIVSDLNTGNGIEHNGSVTFAIAKALRNDFPGFERVTQSYVEDLVTCIIPGNEGSRKILEQKGLAYADEYFLKTFEYPVLAGDKAHFLSTPDEIVLTQSVAEKFFGANESNDFSAIIGRTIQINQVNYRVSGILKDPPGNTNVGFKMLLPFKAFERSHGDLVTHWKEVWGQSNVFVTLPASANPKQIDAALVAFKDKYLDKEEARRMTYHLQPLASVHTDETYGGTMYATPSILLLAFITMATIVLITACINFINLATAQALKKAKEIGVRKTLGSGRMQLMLRFMGETFLIVSLSSLVALVIAQQFIDAFNHYLSFIVDFGLSIDYTIIYFLTGIVLLTTFLAGYYPARVMSNYRPIEALKNAIRSRNTGFNGRFSLRKALVVAQFTMSQVLIIGTIVVATQMSFFRSHDLGYRKDGVLVIDLPENDQRKLDLLRDALRDRPEVASVSFSSTPPTSGNSSEGGFRLLSAPNNDMKFIERKFVDPEYLSTYQIKLLAGRNLQETDRFQLSDTAGRFNVLLNRRAIGELGFKNPEEAIGQIISVDNRNQAVIAGVVENFYNVPVKQDIRSSMLFYATNWRSIANIRFNPGHPVNAQTIDYIRSGWEKIFPDHLYKAMTLEEYLNKQAFYIIEDIMYQAFKIFVFLSVLIGCLGLYGLISYLALQRQKEIGVRKVLGASVQGIVYLFSREFLVLVGIAFLIAAPLSYFAMSSWLETFSNRIRLSAWFFVLAFLVSLLIAAVTIGSQAIKAATANPAKSLKTE